MWKGQMKNYRVYCSLCLATAVGTCLLVAGCAEQDKQQQLESVAKDWCQVVRASQVIPVYPLTEDLQPGDVFLVTTPVQDQASQYKKRGYLPLDQMLKRLDGLDAEFARFYGPDYWEGTYEKVPHPRPAPTDDGSGLRRFRTALAPTAGFPSYTFDVRSGAGIELALPIQGVPVGLALLNTAKAKGTIKIQDAYTYGLDGQALLQRLRGWLKQDTETRAELRALVAAHETPLYLRVVTRIYLTGRAEVTLFDLSARRGQADVGAAKKFDLMNLDAEKGDDLLNAANAYKNALDALSEVINEGLPGGSLRVAAVTSRSVTLDEHFGRLLAIGYLGFDMEIFSNGELGPPIATQTILYAPEKVPRITAGNLTESQRNVMGRLLYIKDIAGISREQDLREAMVQVDAALQKPSELDGFRRELDNGTYINELWEAFYVGVGDYLGSASTSSIKYHWIMTVLDQQIGKLEGGT